MSVCLGWFVFAMRDPNYKWIIVNDNAMRLRNGVAMVVLIYGILMGRRFQRLASGKLAVARIAVDGNVVIVTKDSMTPLFRPRVERVMMPVDVKVEEHPEVSLMGSYMRTIRLKGHESSSRVNALGPLQDGNGDALRAFLTR
jgi:hypothetical protein